MKKIIYSALVGNYDNIPDIPFKNDEWEYILFTDQTTEKIINGWEIKQLVHNIQGDNTRTARWHKTNPHKLFKDCICSIFIDCNIEINSNYIYNRAEELINQNIKIASIKHPFRDCIYKEAIACIELGKDSKHVINSQIQFLKTEKYPKNNGLFETNIFFRNHQFNEIEKINEEWWDIIHTRSKRDQLSLNYLLWKHNLTAEYFFKDKNLNARNSTDFKFKESHKIDNSSKELSLMEYEILKNKSEALSSIRKTISYKLFVKLELKLKKLINK